MLRSVVRDRLRTFPSAQHGSLAVFFALALVPVMLMLGIAVDYARAATARSMMQAALDATALTLSRQVSSLATIDIQPKAKELFLAEFKDSKVSNLVVTADYVTAGTTKLTVTAKGDFNVAFTGLLGKASMPIGSKSVTTWGTTNTRMRVALVLDNTGSMNDSGKLAALKLAAKSLLLSLSKSATTNGDVYVSIIPFSQDVNAKYASSVTSAGWLDWTTWDPAKTTTRTTYDWVCTSYYRGYCTWWDYQPTTTSTTASHSTWNGCVMDRTQSADVTNDEPTSAATYFPADPDISEADCPTPITPLTYDWTALNAAVDAMTANGYTNQTIGLQWGFQSLTAASPLTVPAKPTGYTYRNVVILLTDGLNTANRWYAPPSGKPSNFYQTQIDARTALVCANIKTAGITRYAIQVSTDTDPKSTMLQACADTDKYYFLTSSSTILPTFDKIAAELTQLRISQ